MEKQYQHSGNKEESIMSKPLGILWENFNMAFENEMVSQEAMFDESQWMSIIKSIQVAQDTVDRILRVEAPPVSNGVQSGLCTGCSVDGLLYSVVVPLTGRSKLLCYSCRSVFTK